MGLVSAYVHELTLTKNYESFERRMEYLKSSDKESYDKIIHDICLYQVKIQDELMKLVQDSLELGETDEIIVNSHETYQERKLLMDHMVQVSSKRLEKQNSKKSKSDKKLNADDEEQIYKYYSEKNADLNDKILNNPDQIEGADKSANIVEE